MGRTRFNYAAQPGILAREKARRPADPTHPRPAMWLRVLETQALFDAGNPQWEKYVTPSEAAGIRSLLGDSVHDTVAGLLAPQ